MGGSGRRRSSPPDPSEVNVTERDDTTASSGRRLAIATAIIAAGALLFWLARAPDDELPAARSLPDATEADAPGTEAEPAGGSAESASSITAPRIVIPDKGRLEVDRETLRKGSVVALGLDMPDDVRAEGPLATTVVDVTRERVLEVEAVPVSGAGTGVQLEIDTEWLEPGPYMIQVKTNEKSHLPIRRYVLEVE